MADNAPMPCCPECGSPIPKLRRTFCSRRCGLLKQRRVAKDKAAIARSLGLCRLCGSDAGGRSYCKACARRNVGKYNALRARWRRAKLCVRCGREREPGLMHCSLCLAYLAEWRRRRRG